MSKEYNLKLDVKRPSYERLCGFKIGDSLAVINGVMLQNSTSYNLTGLTLRVNFKDSKGNLYFQDATKGVSIINPLEGTFKINVLPSVLSVEGIIKADISIFKGTQKLTSSTFSMEVVESIYNGTAIIGEGGKDLLQEIVEGEAKRINAEKVRDDNEVDRKKGEVKREANEVVREGNEVVRKEGYSKMDTRIDNLVLGQGSQTEVIDSRLDGVSNKVYPTLKARLDHTSKQLFDSSLSTISTSNSITSIENSTDGILQIDSVKGRTLQNVVINGDFSKGTANWVSESGSTLSASGNVGIATGNGSTKHLGIAQFLNPSFFSATHKVYSRMMVRTTDSGVDVKPEILLQFRDASLITVDKISTAYQNAWYNLSGITSIVGHEAPYIRAIIFYSTVEQQKNRVLQVKDAMILDLTQMFGAGNEPTKEWCDANLNWFDGVKSTGEKEGNKIEVLSVGKNLFDKSKIIKGIFQIANTGGTTANTSGWVSKDYIHVNQNTDYAIAKGIGSGTYGYCFYDSSKTYISGVIGTSGVTNPQKITTPPHTAYIKLSGLVEALDTQQFEKGGISTQYEPYKSDKSEITLGSPLKGLSSGISDETVGDRVNRRIDKVALNGSEIYKLSRVKEKTILYTTASPTNAKISNLDNMNILSNNFIGKYVYNLDEEGIFFSASQNIYISILKSKLATPDLEGIKKWLSENPTEVYYELAEQTISSVNPTSLKSFKDGSIILNNAITPIIDLKYPTSISGRLSSVETILDNTVDRTKKLEEGPLTTVTQVIDNKNKIEQLDLDIDRLEETLKPTVSTTSFPYSTNVIGESVIYKQNNCINIPFRAQLKSLPTSALTKVGQLEYRHFPAQEINIMAIDGDATEKLGAVKILTDGSVYVVKYGTGITDFKCNIFYITNN